MFEDHVLRYADHSMQLLSDKCTPRSTKGLITSDDVVGTAEDSWEGFGEEESERQVDASRMKGKASLEKNTRKSKKLRKQEEKRQKRAASQPNMSKNAFEALGTADKDEQRTDDEEGDGK